MSRGEKNFHRIGTSGGDVFDDVMKFTSFKIIETFFFLLHHASHEPTLIYNSSLVQVIYHHHSDENLLELPFGDDKLFFVSWTKPQQTFHGKISFYRYLIMWKALQLN
jgi:hypothetical protein